MRWDAVYGVDGVYGVYGVDGCVWQLTLHRSGRTLDTVAEGIRRT